MPHVTPKPAVVAVIPHRLWKLKYADSQEAGKNKLKYAAAKAFDGSTKTFWHTDFSGSATPCPHEIQIDLGRNYNLSSFRYLPRQDGSPNGMIGQYEFNVSADGITWGAPVAGGTFFATPAEKQVDFTTQAGRYIRLRALSEVNGKAWTAVANINVTGGTIVK